VEALSAIATPGTLVLQSTDFSHYLPPRAAARHDQQVLNILATGDLDRLALLRQPAHLDSLGSQYIQFKLQRERFHATPIVLSNSNSRFYPIADETRTTSYIVQIYAASVTPAAGTRQPGSQVYCFAGDTFFGRGVGHLLAQPGAGPRLLDSVKSLLGDCRLVVNLEGVPVRRVPRHGRSGTLLMDEAVTLRWLRRLNIVAASVANNHAGDAGPGAYRAMVRRLSRAGIAVLRPGRITRVGPLRVAAFSDLDNTTGALSGLISGRAIAQIDRRRIKPPSVAFMHWGVEWLPAATARQRALAEAMANAGFDVIVGAHPHVRGEALASVGASDALAAYSLGNFMFDQTARRASGSVLEVRVFDQGTWFARLLPIPNLFDAVRKRAGPAFPAAHEGGENQDASPAQLPDREARPLSPAP
jgi:poly-gamma-glutamate synthesis protein (capsule biosynthesis protein)